MQQYHSNAKTNVNNRELIQNFICKQPNLSLCFNSSISAISAISKADDLAKCMVYYIS